MNTLPSYISLVFIATTLLTVWLFFRASNYSKTAFIAIIFWAIVQSILMLSGFYLDTKSVPPRIVFLVAPTLFCFIILFNSPKGKAFLDGLSIEKLTLLHTVRIPIEIVLFWLYLHKTIPQLMTFEGRNFDILAGITAPIVYYFVFVKQTMSKNMLLVWNFACLALLLNIVVNAILSAPLPFQQFAFDQPNIGVLYFPFSLLPSVIVPLVLLSHLVAIRQILKE